jgi:hypothetical protein
MNNDHKLRTQIWVRLGASLVALAAGAAAVVIATLYLKGVLG